MSKKKLNVFKAIADPTRREIIHLLVLATTAMSINQLSDHFDVSRQAVSKHLTVLSEAGLITFSTEGREKFCYPDLKPLKEVHQWVGFYEKFWDQKLDALQHYLDQQQ